MYKYSDHRFAASKTQQCESFMTSQLLRSSSAIPATHLFGVRHYSNRSSRRLRQRQASKTDFRRGSLLCSAAGSERKDAFPKLTPLEPAPAEGIKLCQQRLCMKLLATRVIDWAFHLGLNYLHCKEPLKSVMAILFAHNLLKTEAHTRCVWLTGCFPDVF